METLTNHALCVDLSCKWVRDFEIWERPGRAFKHIIYLFELDNGKMNEML